MRISRLLTLAVVTPIFTAGAQRATGRIEGRVEDPQSGKPLAGAQVVLFAPADTAIVRTAATNAVGRFEFVGLRAAQYRVRVTHARLDSLELVPLTASVRLPRGQTRSLSLGGKPISVAADGACGEGQFDHPAGIEIAYIDRTVGNGAAQVATLRPGFQGINTQYTLVEGCRRAPLSERGVVPPF